MGQVMVQVGWGYALTENEAGDETLQIEGKVATEPLSWFGSLAVPFGQ